MPASSSNFSLPPPRQSRCVSESRKLELARILKMSPEERARAALGLNDYLKTLQGVHLKKLHDEGTEGCL